MTKLIYIGIDDTDIPGGPGTGKIARGLAEHLESLHAGKSKGVIRHQLLVDPRIPYTSHNSSKCVLFESSHTPEKLLQPCIEYMKEHFQVGSDPGLCLAGKDQFSEAMISFGCSAQNVYIPKKETIDTARRNGIILRELGGTGDGIIGAFAAVALSIRGNDGRFVQLRGIKEIDGLITVAQIMEKTDTAGVVDEQGNPVPVTALVDSLGWLRPSLVNGQPVLRVRQENDGSGSTIWRQIERKHKSEKE